jgi:thioredoxin reductase (NADPH)
MLTTAVDNYPGFPEGIQGPELMAAIRKQAERFGAEFIQKNAVKVDFSKKPFEIATADQSYLANSVIIATGALTKWLEAPGVQEFIGKGVSSCAPCDAPFFKDKKVAVVGGGDSAMEEANVLTKYASEVTLIHRRDEFRASIAMQKKVMTNPKVKILWNTEVKEVKGSNKVEKLVVVNNKDQTTSEIAIDGLFVAIGHKPDSDIFKGPIEMDERGYIKVQNHTKTNLPGVFVAGDVHDDLFKQAVTAAGFGCMAGMEALKYLEELKESQT